MLYFASDDDWPDIPPHPTLADAKHALAKLLVPFGEFPFVSAGDKATHVAAILTALERPLLGACPLFAYSAPTMRYGKSLLAAGVSILAVGQPAAASAISKDREEIRKAILSALREGQTIITLDNVDEVLESPDLARVITEERYSDRVLGESRRLSLPTNVLWIATGNNITFRGDLTTRVVLCRIDAGIERPEEREFKIPNLLSYLRRHRCELVTAALTILRAFHVAGRPKQEIKPWGGFDEWSEVIRSAIVWVGMEDPYLTREQVIDDDPERENTIVALRELASSFGENLFTLSEVRTHAKQSHTVGDEKKTVLDHPALYDAVSAVASSRKDKIDAWVLGSWARRWRDRVIGQFCLRKDAKNRKATRWTVEKHS